MNIDDLKSGVGMDAREATDDEALNAVFVLLKRILRTPPASDGSAGALDPWLTPAEASAHAAVSEDTLRAWISSGLLPTGRVGRVIRVRRSEIDALLTRRGQSERDEPAREEGEPEFSTLSGQRSRTILKSLGPASQANFQRHKAKTG